MLNNKDYTVSQGAMKWLQNSKKHVVEDVVAELPKIDVEPKLPVGSLMKTDQLARADSTFMISFIWYEGTQFNKQDFTLPIVPYSTIRDVDKEQLLFDYDFSMLETILPKNKEYQLIVDYTDDPSAPCAGCVVSLGYPLVRINIKEKAKIVSYNPLTIETPRDTLHILHNREQRESYCFIPDEQVLNPNFKLVREDYLEQYNILNGTFLIPLYVISKVIGDKYYTIIERIDMTSFYSPNVLVYFREHKNEQEAEHDYDNLVKLWSIKLGATSKYTMSLTPEQKDKIMVQNHAGPKSKVENKKVLIEV